MYGIFTYIYHKNKPKVGEYTLHGSYGIYIYMYPMGPTRLDPKKTPEVVWQWWWDSTPVPWIHCLANSWEPKVPPPMPRKTPQEIAGLIKGNRPEK